MVGRHLLRGWQGVIHLFHYPSGGYPGEFTTQEFYLFGVVIWNDGVHHFCVVGTCKGLVFLATPEHRTFGPYISLHKSGLVGYLVHYPVGC